MIIGAGCSFGKELITKLADCWDTFILTEHKDRFGDLLKNMDILHKLSPNTKVYSYRVDLTDISEINRLMLDIEKEEVTINAAVYCAGVNILESALNVTEDIWDAIINVNLKGFFFVAKSIAAHMVLSDIKGSILAIASQHAIVANYNRAPYCASKAGLVHLIKEMALEFAESGIRFNAISPSFIINDRNTNQLYSYQYQQEYLEKIPVGKYAVPDDIAFAVKFLLSDESAYITGHNLIIDGGYTIK